VRLADSILATVAAGNLIRGVDPTSTSMRHGVYLPLAAGWSLALWPETRPGATGRSSSPTEPRSRAARLRRGTKRERAREIPGPLSPSSTQFNNCLRHKGH
jgi:hypothetical protein